MFLLYMKVYFDNSYMRHRCQNIIFIWKKIIVIGFKYSCGYVQIYMRISIWGYISYMYISYMYIYYICVWVCSCFFFFSSVYLVLAALFTQNSFALTSYSRQEFLDIGLQHSVTFIGDLRLIREISRTSEAANLAQLGGIARRVHRDRKQRRDEESAEA